MKYKIGIFGSAEGKDIKKYQTIATQLGKILGRKKNEITIITGACPGLPFLAAQEAFRLGTEIWGYSQTINFSKQKILVKTDNAIYKKIFYIPQDYEFADNTRITKKYRNVTSTANCDAGIIISGRWGTLNEFTNLYDMGKIIGTLIGTGGIADELPTLCQKIIKKSNSKLFFSPDPEILVNKILTQLKKSKI